MNQILDAFGINWMGLVYYLINFLILFFILYKLGYKSILKFVHDRTAEIEKGLENAQEAAKTLSAAQEKQEALLAEARKEASGLLEEARKRGDEHIAAAKTQAQAEIEKMIESGKAAMAADHEKMMREIRTEAVSLVVATTEKVLGQKVDATVDKQFVESLMK